MEVRFIEKEITEIKVSNKKDAPFIEQMKFIGAVPFKESSRYTYFRFNGDMNKTMKMLGLR